MVLYSGKQQADYVRRTSQKLFMMRQLNAHYAAAISSKKAIMKLVHCFADYMIPCPFMTVYNQLTSSKEALFCKLKENNSLKAAVKAIINYNTKAEAYQRAAFRIFKDYSNEFHYDSSVMSYKKFCRIESRLFEKSFQMPVIHFGMYATISYINLAKTQTHETEIELSQQELTCIFGFDKLKFDGIPVQTLLDGDCPEGVRGCYVLYNKTLNKFYIGCSENIYGEIRSFFTGNTFKLVANEFAVGGDFYIRVVRLDTQDEKEIYGMASYLSWCYSDKDGTDVVFVNQLKKV